MKNIFALGFICLTLFFSGCSESEIFDDKVLATVKKFNSKCPMVVDSETRIDGIEIKNQTL